MPDSFDKLRRAVFAELRKQQARGDLQARTERAKHFGAFVDACLVNLGRSRADLAKALDIERELADAVLDGLLPESEIDDEFLIEIARVIQYEPNLLRIMLGREVNPTLREDNV